MNILVIVGACVAVVSVGFFFFGMVRNGYEAIRLNMGHEEVEALIVTDGLSRSKAEYTFSIDGENYRGQAGREDAGNTVRVAYLPDNPAVNRPADRLTTDILFGVGIIIGAIALLGYVFLGDKLQPQPEREADALADANN